MKENLFRGISKLTGKWVYGYFVAYKDEFYIFEPNEVERGLDVGGWINCCVMTEIVPSTLGQYTDLTVKDKKVFEGDVVRYGDRIGYVMYCNGCFCVKDIYTLNHPAIDIVMAEFNVEIIGNTHDNPELLEVAE